MIVLSNTKPLAEGEAAAPTSSNSLLGRRSNTSTTSSSPPPYEATSPVASSLVRDEKRRQRGSRHKSRLPKEPRHELKPAYTELPSEFSRVAAVNFLTLKPFDPLTILVGGSGRALDKGLSLELPPSTEELHPFIERDISKDDWQRFMQDLRDGTAISNRTKHNTLIIPLALGLGLGAFFVSRAVKARMRRKKLAYAINLINTWNQYFFVPRGVEVVLMRGDRSLTISKSTSILHSTDRNNLMHQDNPSSASLSSHSSSSSSGSSSKEKEEKKENSIGCCNQPTTPMRLVVVPI